MTIQAIEEKLQRERAIPSRYPVRVIFVENLTSYCALVCKLQGICNCVVNVADFCRAQDTLPQLEKIKKKLDTFRDKQVLILSMGEYLRFAMMREIKAGQGSFRGFWEMQQDVSLCSRYIVPIFAGRYLFERVIGQIDDRQQDFVWELSDDVPPANYKLEIYSKAFQNIVQADAYSLSEWLHNWAEILTTKTVCKIITERWQNAESSNGPVSLRIIASMFQYFSSLLVDGNKLVETWGNDAFWAGLVETYQRLRGHPKDFRSFALMTLNIHSFDFVALVTRWEMMTQEQKNILWIWYRFFPVDDYFSFVVNKAKFAFEIPSMLCEAIFSKKNEPEAWLSQRLDAIRALHPIDFPASYFERLDEMDAEKRLRFLTCHTERERAYVLRAVSELLREEVSPEALAEEIKPRYPELAVYLSESIGCEKVDPYFNWYRKQKVINRFATYPYEIPRSIFDQFDARCKLIQELCESETFVFWIDGFGVEWMPVFLYELKKRGINPDAKEIATALLPTETKFNYRENHQDSLTDKWLEFDQLAHKGLPDDHSYFSCMVRQMDFLVKAAAHVDELLNEHDTVLVTGDHGASRMAALAFHRPEMIIPTPNGAQVYSFGRFCELREDDDVFYDDDLTKCKLYGKIFLVMNGYCHFSVSGNAAGGNTDEQDVAGEVHGGNTLEERLVPVILLRREHPHKEKEQVDMKNKQRQQLKKNGIFDNEMGL